MFFLVSENYLAVTTLTWIQMPNQLLENPRRVPISVRDELKNKIEELETIGAIAKVTKPTPWMSNMVVVRKPNKLRLCLDPMHLNKGVIRNHYPTPNIEGIAPKLNKANVSSVVDQCKGRLPASSPSRAFYKQLQKG